MFRMAPPLPTCGPLIRPLAWPTLGGREPWRQGGSFTFLWCGYYQQLAQPVTPRAPTSDQATGAEHQARGETG